MKAIERKAELLAELANLDPETAELIRANEEEKAKAKNHWDEWAPITMADAMADRPPIDYAVTGLFEIPSVNVIYGAPGCLKSFFAADMAACIANGAPWLDPLTGRTLPPKTTQKNAVMWIDCDNGKRRTQDRFKALLAAHTFKANTPVTVFCHPTPPFKADDDREVKALCNRIVDYGARVVIIDNLGTVTGAAEENSADMARVMANFRGIAEYTGAAVILIHHQRKGGANGNRAGDALRGHSSIEAALDLALWIEREPGSEIITVTPTKTRGADVDPFAAYFAYSGSGEVLEGARFFGYPCQRDTQRSQLSWALDLLREASQNEPEINQTRWIEIIKNEYSGQETMTEKKARGLISTLENTGKVTVTPGQHRAKYYRAA